LFTKRSVLAVGGGQDAGPGGLNGSADIVSRTVCRASVALIRRGTGAVCFTGGSVGG
jgi:hypothetical protein